MTAKPPPQPRPDLAGLTAYVPSKPSEGIFLDANENPYEPPPEVMDEILAELSTLSLNRYPDHTAGALRASLADYAGVDPDWVWIGTGSNEILLDACLTFGGAGRCAMLFTPTYSMHHRQAIVAGTRVEAVPRGDDFAIDVTAAVRAISRSAPEIVFLCTPNNPTGTATPLADVKKIAKAAPGVLLLDEAYYEFCGSTLVGELARFPNVIVVRTLSKAFRMAGVRLGYAIAHPDTVAPMLKVRMPYAQSSLAQVAARIAVERREALLMRVPDVVIERERLAIELSRIDGMEVFASEANFLLFRHPSWKKIAAGLKVRGIMIRDFSGAPGLDGCLRVSAGKPNENSAFLRAVAELV